MSNINSSTTINIAFLITLILFIITVYKLVKENRKDVKSDIDEEVEKAKELLDNQNKIDQSFVKVNMKLDELCRGNQAIQITMEKATNEIKELTKKQILTEEKVNTLFHYKDDHEGRIAALEKRSDD